MIPTAITGIFASLVLGFGRALGETMALAMIIGNANQVSLSLFSPANTLAALLASNFPEAGDIEREALMYAAVVLLLVTLVVNLLGTLIMAFAGKQQVSCEPRLLKKRLPKSEREEKVGGDVRGWHRAGDLIPAKEIP